MEIPSKLINKISPKLNKNELLLIIILLDLCKQPECEIGKALLYKHPLMTSTLKYNLPSVSNTIIGKKIICNTYYDKAEEKHVLLEKITREGVSFKIKFNKDVFDDINSSETVFVENNLFTAINSLSEIKFMLWFKTWEHTEKQRMVDIVLLKTYLNKQNLLGEFIAQRVSPIVSKLSRVGIFLDFEKIHDENDKRYVKALLFKNILRGEPDENF